MFSGKVSAWYARAHHEKWYYLKLKEEAEWEDEVEHQVQEATEGTQLSAHPLQPG